ncbi:MULTISPECIES: hypothetical protein [Kitasatospora]|uniref:hypothetical protein n=1 Tax=Kitasatospora TaxID=2063 RepID=UPI0004BF3D18|nr:MULTISPECIES: hypothetical protein [Kitasatospora]
MRRPSFFKRPLPVAVAALVVGAAAATGVPALADGQNPGGAHRGGASIPWVTISSSGYTTAQGGVPQELGNSFGTRTTLLDQYGENTIGTIYSTCSKVEAGPDQLYCTSLLKYGPEKQVTLSVVVPLGDGAAKEFDGTITGGNYAFEGASGVAHFTLKNGNYEVTFP